MTLVQVTVNLAFHDIIGATAEMVKNQIIDHALDGFEAEVAFTSEVKQREVTLPDPDMDGADADEQIEAWQERAREELSK